MTQTTKATEVETTSVKTLDNKAYELSKLLRIDVGEVIDILDIPTAKLSLALRLNRRDLEAGLNLWINGARDSKSDSIIKSRILMCLRGKLSSAKSIYKLPDIKRYLDRRFDEDIAVAFLIRGVEIAKSMSEIIQVCNLLRCGLLKDTLPELFEAINKRMASTPEDFELNFDFRNLKFGDQFHSLLGSSINSEFKKRIDDWARENLVKNIENSKNMSDITQLFQHRYSGGRRRDDIKKLITSKALKILAGEPTYENAVNCISSTDKKLERLKEKIILGHFMKKIAELETTTDLNSLYGLITDSSIYRLNPEKCKTLLEKFNRKFLQIAKLEIEHEYDFEKIIKIRYDWQNHKIVDLRKKLSEIALNKLRELCQESFEMATTVKEIYEAWRKSYSNLGAKFFKKVDLKLRKLAKIEASSVTTLDEIVELFQMLPRDCETRKTLVKAAALLI